MVVAFEPVTVVQQFFYDTLRQDPTVLEILGSPPAIRPGFSPDERPDIFVTPRYEDMLNVGMPIGGSSSWLKMRWRLVGWRRGYSTLGLRAVMKAIMTSLVGANVRGKQFSFVDSDGIGWAIGVQYVGSPPTEPEPEETEVWQLIAAYYDVDLRQKG